MCPGDRAGGVGGKKEGGGDNGVTTWGERGRVGEVGEEGRGRPRLG